MSLPRLQRHGGDGVEVDLATIVCDVSGVGRRGAGGGDERKSVEERERMVVVQTEKELETGKGRIQHTTTSRGKTEERT